MIAEVPGVVGKQTTNSGRFVPNVLEVEPPPTTDVVLLTISEEAKES
jgi:hypothetical protein